ncbi:cyclophilin-like fold protein [Pseudoflavonifractor sp. An187]|uniref:cyclophilin-like fold protein n=1 Tax=Pseudoflavonifractor sp. An187 TaxID=1965578 RepID=UPI000B3AD879|nr:cyclophilin-like fold protein [Pseudoflavonifractor sp. An187]OUP45406.1 hypothetical protein B5F22_04310 [Pseudoflavonifractor sp. An187]
MKRIGFALWAVVLVLCLAACSTASHPSPTSTISPEPTEDTTVDTHTFYLTVEGVTFPATFADNQGAEALADLLTDGPLTLSLEDYGGFEKVGSLGQSLPTSNTHITTQSGDIMLYQGNQIVLFYGSNSWSYTRLGQVTDLTGWQEALGHGDVTVTFSLTAPH